VLSKFEIPKGNDIKFSQENEIELSKEGGDEGSLALYNGDLLMGNEVGIQFFTRNAKKEETILSPGKKGPMCCFLDYLAVAEKRYDPETKKMTSSLTIYHLLEKFTVFKGVNISPILFLVSGENYSCFVLKVKIS